MQNTKDRIPKPEAAVSTNGDTTVIPHDTESADDQFSLDSLRLTQDFGAVAGVKPLVKTVPVKKPSKEWFVRTHPDPAYRLQTLVLELKDDKDRAIYLIAPPLWEQLAAESCVSPRLLIASISRQGVLFVWPIRLAGSDGKVDNWNKSSLDAANEAETRWVRVVADMNLGAYQIFAGSEKISEPTWPQISFQEIIKIAFRDNMISDWEHPVLKRLRGEA